MKYPDCVTLPIHPALPPTRLPSSCQAQQQEATADISPEENKAVVHRYIEEVWNRHDLDAIDDLVSPTYFNHAASPEYQRAGAAYSVTWLLSVFPDHRFEIEDIAADGETFAVRGTCRGTHERELGSVRPTGKRFAAQQSTWFRVEEGKIVEHWAAKDDLGMMRQLGIMLSELIACARMAKGMITSESTTVNVVRSIWGFDVSNHQGSNVAFER